MAFGQRLINTGGAGSSGPTGATLVDSFTLPTNYNRGIGADGTDIAFLNDVSNFVGFSDINNWKTFYETMGIVAGVSEFRAFAFQTGTNYFWIAPRYENNLTFIYRWTRGQEFSNAQINYAGRVTDISWSDEGLLLTNIGNTVVVYNSSNAIISTFQVSQHSGNLSIAWDGENIWCGGNSDNFIYKYDKSGNYLGVSIDMGSQFNYLAYDGIYFYTMNLSVANKYTALF